MAKKLRRVTAQDYSSTGRIYARAQHAFAEWCAQHDITQPDHAAVAHYLADCSQTRGLTAVPVHLSALADLFRSQGRYLDTRALEIQAVLGPIRQAMKRGEPGISRWGKRKTGG